MLSLFAAERSMFSPISSRDLVAEQSLLLFWTHRVPELVSDISYSLLVPHATYTSVHVVGCSMIRVHRPSGKPRSIIFMLCSNYDSLSSWHVGACVRACVCDVESVCFYSLVGKIAKIGS